MNSGRPIVGIGGKQLGPDRIALSRPKAVFQALGERVGIAAGGRRRFDWPAWWCLIRLATQRGR
ncbi:hypothetical protein A5646_07220 [Mycobacterium sp. 1245499.0]|uniref:hypothetical protein n=1 Tax=unclassified Mycobacterium TaxID=2642494 RepID=UPI0007FE5059|nr:MULTISPECIES: hypothetical protein [unclassified Mycobacterium]OBK08253.1 hypothetical protein A9W96_13165 [Mycobacterium sp. 1245852.3]OBL15312.1 hypothetical protein A5646_07220 [Mycobacterium sp. 1245499.0]